MNQVLKEWLLFGLGIWAILFVTGLGMKAADEFFSWIRGRRRS